MINSATWAITSFHERTLESSQVERTSMSMGLFLLERMGKKIRQWW